MKKILYSNINQIEDHEISLYASTLPEVIKDEIFRYKFIPDIKARLLARLMLHKSIQDTGGLFNLQDVKRTANKKPYIEGWLKFNISHSGEIVLLICSDSDIGIDIERKKAINSELFTEVFHPNELELLEMAKNRDDCFYHLWVKKEALLKATGVGLNDSLNKIDISREFVYFRNHNYYFNEILFDPEYVCYICSLSNNINVSLNKFEISYFKFW